MTLPTDPGGASDPGRTQHKPGDLPPAFRRPLLALGFISLLLGIAGGLVRIGISLPITYTDLVALHGPLMVSGFFGTVIGLERAVALGRRWAYFGPALTGLGGLTLILGLPWSLGAALILLGSLGLLAASLVILRRQRAVFTGTLVLGALCWTVGSLLWFLGANVYAIVPWWAAFLVLTIAGERLELSRFLPPSVMATRIFSAGLALFVVSLALSELYPTPARSLLALILIGLTLWLLRYDIARRTVKNQGLTRFIAVSLLSAYFWLGVSALTGILSGGLFTITAYDAGLHALFVGFVFSMVFGHAPIIFPSVTGFRITYHPIFYLHLALLHISLALRIAGDFLGYPELRALGGTGNAAAIIVFLLNTVAAILRGQSSEKQPG